MALGEVNIKRNPQDTDYHNFSGKEGFLFTESPQMLGGGMSYMPRIVDSLAWLPSLIPVEVVAKVAENIDDFSSDIATLVSVVTSFFHGEHRSIRRDMPMVKVHVFTCEIDEIRAVGTFVPTDSGHG